MFYTLIRVVKPPPQFASRRLYLLPKQGRLPLTTRDIRCMSAVLMTRGFQCFDRIGQPQQTMVYVYGRKLGLQTLGLGAAQGQTVPRQGAIPLGVGQPLRRHGGEMNTARNTVVWGKRLSVRVE